MSDPGIPLLGINPPKLITSMQTNTHNCTFIAI